MDANHDLEAARATYARATGRTVLGINAGSELDALEFGYRQGRADERRASEERERVLRAEIVMLAQTQSPMRLGPTSAALAGALAESGERERGLREAIEQAERDLLNYAAHIDDSGGAGGSYLRDSAALLRNALDRALLIPENAGDKEGEA